MSIVLKIILTSFLAIFGMLYMLSQTEDLSRIPRILSSVAAGIVVFAVVFWIMPNSSSKSSNELKDKNGRIYAQCSSCDTKYYSDAFDNENYWSIRDSSMCKRCYKNFKDVKDAVDHYKLND